MTTSAHTRLTEPSGAADDQLQYVARSGADTYERLIRALAQESGVAVRRAGALEGAFIRKDAEGRTAGHG